MSNQIVLPKKPFGFGRNVIFTQAATNEVTIPFVGIFEQTGSTPPPPTGSSGGAQFGSVVT